MNTSSKLEKIIRILHSTNKFRNINFKNSLSSVWEGNKIGENHGCIPVRTLYERLYECLYGVRFELVKGRIIFNYHKLRGFTLNILSYVRLT